MAGSQQPAKRGMSEPAIQEAVCRILLKIAPEAHLNDVPPNENLREALDIDSFDFLNLLIGLHEELKVEIPESDYGKLTTLAALVSYISERLNQGVTSAT